MSHSYTQYFGLHDATVALLACFSGVVGQALPAFLRPSWAFYLGSIINSFSPAATITARTLASRCVSAEEVGRVFGVFSLVSAVSSSGVTAAFQAIYAATIDSFAGTFLLVNAGLFLVTVPTNIYLRKNL